MEATSVVPKKPVYADPFNPVLRNTPDKPEPWTLSQEQMDYIDAILVISSSDSRFAEKASIAIKKVLTVPPAPEEQKKKVEKK